MFGEASYLLYGLIYKPQNVGRSLSQSHSLKQNVDRVRRQQLTFSPKYLIWFVVQRQDGHVVRIPNCKTQPRSPVANKKVHVITNKPRITYMPTCTCIQLNIKIKLAISFMYMHIPVSNIRDSREKCVFRFVFISLVCLFKLHAYNGHVTLPPFYGTFTQNLNAMTSKMCFKYTCNHQSKPLRFICMAG